MTLQISISIPYALAEAVVKRRELVNVYETNQVIRALDTWLVLKHLSVRCPFIQDWNQQKKTLLQICKISEAVFRHRLKLLSNLKLVKYGKTIELCSWQQLGKVFACNTERRFDIQYTTGDKARVQEWIIATDILNNQSRQKIAILRKLHKNPVNKKAVEHYILKSGGNKDQLQNSDYLLAWLKMQYINDFVQASELHDILVAIRPDTNRGVKGMKTSWNFRNICSISYWKKILQKAGIIDITKLQIESSDRVRNPECKVLWLKDIKQTLLCMCDQITVLQPWNRLNLSLG